jgi:hypothetical protein
VNGRLQAINHASRERTKVMLDACVEILAAFRQAGIEVMLLKGAVLAPIIYTDPMQRPLADLDLLIRPQDVAASRAIMLHQLGYRYYSRSAEDEVYLRGERQANIWAPDNVHPVEVHFTLREEYAGIGYELAEVMWRESAERPYWQNTIARIPNPCRPAAARLRPHHQRLDHPARPSDAHRRHPPAVRRHAARRLANL